MKRISDSCHRRTVNAQLRDEAKMEILLFYSFAPSWLSTQSCMNKSSEKERKTRNGNCGEAVDGELFRTSDLLVK